MIRRSTEGMGPARPFSPHHLARGECRSDDRRLHRDLPPEPPAEL